MTTIRRIFTPSIKVKWRFLIFGANIPAGDISSRTAVRLIRGWTDLYQTELAENWEDLQNGRGFKKIAPRT